MEDNKEPMNNEMMNNETMNNEIMENENEIEVKVKWRDLRTQKDYLKVLVANTISRFGDSIDAIAFTWLVFAITKSASWSAIILALNYLPTIFIQPFAGTLVENMDKKKIIVITDMIRGLVVAALAVLYLMNLIVPGVLVVFTLIISIAEAFGMPAASALIPKILAKEYYEVGVALSGTLTTIVQLVGLASAGIIIGLFGIQTAIFIDASTFFACALITMTIKYKSKIVEKVKVSVHSVRMSMMEGLHYAMKKEPIRNFLLIAVILNALLVPLNVLQVPLIVEVFKQGSEMMSIMGIAILSGMGLGSLSFPAIGKKVPVLTRMVIGGMMIGSCYILLLSGAYLRFSSIALYVVVFIVQMILGFSAAIMNATVSVLFMKQVEETYYARVSALMNAMATAAMPVTSFAVGAVVAFVSVGKLYLACGILTILLFIVVAVKKLKFQ